MGKGFQRMVKERLRRQSQREAYAGLHANFPFRTKCDKISITTTATAVIMKMQIILKDLMRRNGELIEEVAAKTHVTGASKVRIRVGDPTSGIDSMAEALHCLKNLGSDIRRIRSLFSDHEFSAELEINSQIVKDEVERPVHRTLVKVEEKLLRRK